MGELFYSAVLAWMNFNSLFVFLVFLVSSLYSFGIGSRSLFGSQRVENYRFQDTRDLYNVVFMGRLICNLCKQKGERVHEGLRQRGHQAKTAVKY